MDWQPIAVVLVVAAAVAFLFWRLVLPRRRRKGAQTFVPMSQLRRPAPRKDEPGCH